MAWGDGKPKPWQQLQVIIGASACPHCLNPKRSALHRELCEVGSA